jgi:hypothetical protein
MLSAEPHEVNTRNHNSTGYFSIPVALKVVSSPLLDSETNGTNFPSSSLIASLCWAALEA